jgi:hypothetical protein
MMKKSIILIISLFLFSASAYCTNFQFRLTATSKADIVIAKELLSKVHKLLPKKIKKALSKKKLKIKFKSLNTNSMPTPKCSGELADEQFRYGQYNNLFQTITLDRQLLDAYKNGESIKYNCKHRNLKRKSIAIVLHEVFHAYDSANFTKNSKFEGCPDLSNISSNNNLNSKCKKLLKQYKRRKKVSDDAVFQGMVFWHGKKEKNFQGHRTTDPYENKNQEEYAAVNFEYFMLDEEYQCRRPSHYRYLSKELEFKPFANKKCDSTNQVVINQDGSSLVNLDPSRIYQIHYLLASEGEATMSSFGHSMLRIIQCAPEHIDPLTGDIVPATPYGPECLNDYKYHVIASFRANVDDFMINNVKGMFGGYPSQLYMLPFSEVMNEYNKKEMRDLYSFPLNITSTQKTDLVSKMLELYWEYKGSYKFLSSNCATETYTLISSIFTDVKYHTLTTNTPYGVLDELTELGLISKNYVINDFEKLENHNVFRSNEFYLVKAYGNLNLTKEDINRDTIVKYIHSSADSRLEVLLALEKRVKANMAKDLSRSEKRELNKTVASFLILENQALTTYFHEFLKRVSEIMINLAEKNEIDFDADAYISKFSSQAQDVLAQGYGIPNKSEITKNLSIEDENVSMDKVLIEFVDTLKPYIEKDKIEAQKIEQNIIKARKLRNLIKG